MMRAWDSAWAFCRCAALGVLLGAAFPQQPPDFESLLTAAQKAQAKGDFEAAAGFYQRASTLRPGIAELKANLGLMYYETGKNEQAADAFQQAIRLNPGLFVPNLFLGLANVKLKRFNEAIPYLKSAVRSKPEDVHALKGLGQAYSGLGETRLAIRWYARATRIDPKDADLWYRLGVTYLEQVETDAHVLLSRYKDSAFVQALIAENFAEQRVFNQAAESYRKALSLPSFPPGTHAAFGFVLLNQNNLAGAEEEFKAELVVTPGSLLAKLGFARLELERGSAEKAVAQIAQIWKTDSGFLTANVQRLTTDLASEKSTGFQVAVKNALASGELPGQAASLFQSGRAEAPVSTGQPSEITNADRAQHAPELYIHGAYRKCSDALAPQLSTLTPKDLRLLALCAYASGDYENAFDAAERLSGPAITGVEALYWETRTSQKLATAALAQASEIDSSSPQLHVLLGDVYRQQERWKDAEREYRKALALQSQDTGALFGLSLALLGDRQTGEARQVAQAAVTASPGDPELNAVMGEILCQEEDFSRAEYYLKKGLHANTAYVSHVHALLSKVYANTDRPQEAIAEMKLALPDDKDGRLHYQIGRLYAKLGDRNAAQQAFLEAKRLESVGLARAAAHLGQQGSPMDSR